MDKTYLSVPLTAGLVASLLIGGVGCSSHKERTTVETTTVREDGDSDGRVVVDTSDRGTSTTTTKTETVETDHHDPDRGLFGIIGNIIALPFRAVGALFEAIF